MPFLDTGATVDYCYSLDLKGSPKGLWVKGLSPARGILKGNERFTKWGPIGGFGNAESGSEGLALVRVYLGVALFHWVLVLKDVVGPHPHPSFASWLSQRMNELVWAPLPASLCSHVTDRDQSKKSHKHEIPDDHCTWTLPLLPYFVFYVQGCSVCMDACVALMCLIPEEVKRGNWSRDSCEVSCGCLKLTSSPLQKQSSKCPYLLSWHSGLLLS